MSVTRKLSFRLAAPIVALTVVVWVILYFFVVDTMKTFANDRAREDLKSISREVLNICNYAFNDLAQSRRLNLPTEVRVQEALTLEQLESLFVEFKLDAFIWKTEETQRSTLIATPQAEAIDRESVGRVQPHSLFRISGGKKGFYGYSVDFPPWNWRIVLLRRGEAYERWSGKLRNLYLTTGALLLAMATGLIVLQAKLLRRPVNNIIRDLRRSEAPTYEGLEEFEFLSRSIAAMMQTLAEREARLRESETRYRTIFETTGTAIVITEPDTTISFANSRFLDDTGYSRDEVEGRLSWIQVVSEPDRERLREINELRLANPDTVPRQYEFRLVDKHGQHKHVLLTADIIPGTQQTLASLMDITDRKREELERRLEQEARAAEALREKNLELGREIETRRMIEESLRASEERFRAIFEAAEDYVFIKDTEGLYTHVNPAYLRLLNRPQSDVIGKSDHAVLLDSDYAAYAKTLEERVLQGETFETEHTLTWNDDPVSLNVIRFPLRDSAGKAFGICGIARDVSDRRARRSIRISVPTSEYPSPAIRETTEVVTLAARSNTTVLFLGESGAGKDYWARFLHDHSHRAGGSFLAVNCAALSPTLVESELFGHEAGAFTGARGRKRGLLELAEGGTLLLNEIAEMPLASQSKLLTFLDTRSLKRLGGEKTLQVDTRILVATNRDLEKEVERGAFREDLLYRLDVLRVTVPPLRERTDDLPTLVPALISGLAEQMGLSRLPGIDSTVMQALLQYDWPGNVRELRNVLERALILSRGEQITLDVLGLREPKRREDSFSIRSSFENLLSEGTSFQESVNDAKRFLLVQALERSGGSIKDAAALLGMSRNSIDHHIRHLGIRK